jgi:serine/threonine protein kinase
LSNISIVIEFADNGDLFQKICDHISEKTYFDEKEIWTVFIQLVRGLGALHTMNVMHRDLKVLTQIILECKCIPYNRFASKIGRHECLKTCR